MNAEQNIIVSLPQLIQLLAEQTGVDAAESRKFLHEFFALVEDALVQGNSVKIKGIGSFSVVDRSSGTVSFTPDSELAAAVNTPFAMFEAMELGNGISPDDLAEDEQQATETKEDKEEYVLAI
ncbi:MAG: HU family DNA-binding protein, partial [Muribaculaceae bacterium]|nr:HU family DNA-binding protein [Muribaculaceae bacterium]